MLVPYIASWTSEQQLPATVIERSGAGIAYMDETLADRDEYGVLWQRINFRPGHGRPLYGKLHPMRQRRAMQRLLCGICGGPPDQTEQGTLWLLQDFRGDWPGWPEHMAATEPPVRGPCARLSVRACPNLRQEWVTLRVGRSEIKGVRGLLYSGSHAGPVRMADSTVALEDPAIRWVVAAQLVRELTDCTITLLAEEDLGVQAR